MAHFIRNLFLANSRKACLNHGIEIESVKKIKNWSISQTYEMNHAKQFMEGDFFIGLYHNLKLGKLQSSSGHVDPLMLKEFFDEDIEKWRSFLNFIVAKDVMDIGPCVMSPLATWDGPRKKIIIEPLFNEIDHFQRSKFGGSVFEGLTCHATSAEFFINDYYNKIDGAILCRNMLDHTPNWPFVLSNISAYAMSGCYLLCWTDLDHRGSADEGHYDITPDKDSFRRLINQLGFQIIREYSDEMRKEKNFGFVAIKA